MTSFAARSARLHRRRNDWKPHCNFARPVLSPRVAFAGIDRAGRLDGLTVMFRFVPHFEVRMPTDELLENQPSRYVVGIDLGTTNSAVCYVDTHEQPWRVQVLDIPQ